ncbi:MAG: DMT family transporter, partial [Chloroflexota bacterium]
PSLAIAGGRLGLAALVLLPLAVRLGRDELRTVTRRNWFFIAGAGLLMAAHFAAFITALEYTSVLTVLVFAGTTPFFAAFISWITSGERVRRHVWFGIALAVAGTFLVALGGASGDPPTRDAPLLGNLLAFGAAGFVGMYFAFGREARGQLNNITYSTLVFGTGSLWLLAIGLPLAEQSVLGHSPEAYMWLLAVTLGGQLIGHAGWNLALGGFSATVVSLGLLTVPVTGTVVALLVLQEVPGWLALLGSAVIVSGVAVALVGGRR